MATMARQRTSAALATPEDISRAEASVAPQREALQQFRDDELKASTLARSSEGLALEAKEARDIAVKEAEATQLGLSAEQQRKLTEKTQREIEKNPFPTFKPSQEDAISYSQLGSLVGTLGMMLGGGAKGSAKVAIGAMTGMMKGWQSGRKDLWEREVKTFDKEVQRIKSVHDSIYKDLDMGLKQLATDREAARAKLMAAAWKAGTGSVIATMIQNGRAQDALKIVREGYKLTSDIDKRVQDLAIAQRRHEQQQAAQAAQRAATIEAAKIRAAARGVGDERQKPTADITNKFDTTRDGLNSMTSVLEKLDDPIIQKNWGKGSVELRRFLAERPSGGREDTMLNQFIKQRAIQSLPAEVRDLVITIAAARNEYYKSISGTAVSGNEATRNFGAIIQPSDSLDQLRGKASQVAKKQVERLNEYVDSYSFAPGLIRNAKKEVDRARKYYEATLPAGIPSGSRKIGKSPDGKDVYEAPDGEQYTPD